MKAVASMLLAVSLVGSAHGKGGMAMHGTISDVKVENDTLSFLFTGKLSVQFDTAPRGQKPYTLELQVEKAPVRASKWTNPYDSINQRHAVTFTNAVRFATARAKDGKETGIGIDCPKISSSEDSDGIIMIEGKQISINPPEE